MAKQPTPSAESQSNSSPVSVTLLDPDVFECSICCQALKIPPIFQCENGHLACSPCCEKVEKICTSCKSPNGFSRCRAMERVIEACRVACPNAKYGCKENTSFGNRSSHENQCLFTPCFCPVPLYECNYVGSVKNLHNHVRIKHKDHVIPIAWDTPLTLCMVSSEKIACFQEKKDGELFVLQVFRRSHGVAVSVSCVTHLAQPLGRFSCCLDLIFLEPNIKLKQKFTVKEIQKVSREEPNDSFMLIPSHMLVPTNGDFAVEICFSRGMDSIIRA